VTLRSSEMGSLIRSYIRPLTFRQDICYVPTGLSTCLCGADVVCEAAVDRGPTWRHKPRDLRRRSLRVRISQGQASTR